MANCLVFVRAPDRQLVPVEALVKAIGVPRAAQIPGPGLRPPLVERISDPAPDTCGEQVGTSRAREARKEMCLVIEPDLLSCEEYADFMLASAVAKATVVGLCLLSLGARLARLAVHLWRCGQLKIRSKNVVTKRRTQSLIAIAASLVGTGLGQAYDIVAYRLGEYDAAARGECDRNRTAMLVRHDETVRVASVAIISPMNTTTCIVLLFVFLLWLDLVEKAAMVTFWRKRLVLVVVGVVCVALTIVSIFLSLIPSATAPAIATGFIATYLVHGTLLYYSSVYGPIFARMLTRTGNKSNAAETGSQKIGRLIRVNARFILVSFILAMSAAGGVLFDSGISRCTFQLVSPMLLFLAWVVLINASIMYFEKAENKTSSASRSILRMKGTATSNSTTQVHPTDAVDVDDSA